MNSRRGVLLLLIIIVIIAGLFFKLNRRPAAKPVTPQKVTPTPTSVVPKEMTVQYSSKGFSPSSITIKVGNAIHWKNTTEEKVAINSDDHPTHKKFPELNVGELDKGRDLTHIFMKAGTYTYHNEYKPSEKGTIVVQ